MRRIDRQVEKEAKRHKREREAKRYRCEGEAKRHRHGGRRSVADVEKSKRRQCGEIKVYGDNDFRNCCEWFVSALVANRCEWFAGFVLNQGRCAQVGQYRRFRWFLNQRRFRWFISLRIVVNHSYRRWFRWFIDDDLGGLLATVIGDGLGSYRLGFFWDRGGLGSFGNEGEGLGENRKKIKQIGHGYLQWSLATNWFVAIATSSQQKVVGF